MSDLETPGTPPADTPHGRGSAGSFVQAELASQPSVWEQAIAAAPRHATVLPQHGERVAVVGCGTSWFIAQAYAVRRESLGLGVTDAFAASEFPTGRSYDRVVAISRSGTTTEVLDLLGELAGTAPTVALIGDPESPGARAADATVLLGFADERSVVQTRFATSALTLLRAALGEDLTGLAGAAAAALAEPLPAGLLERTQFTFLGRGFSIGLANEGALKMREAALAWAESYPAMDYRHGPISIADERSAVLILGDVPDGLLEQVQATGALTLTFGREDPQVTLVRCQRLAIELSLARGLDPDEPRNLTRSVILDPTA